MIRRYSMWCAVSHGHQMTQVDLGPSAEGGYVAWADHKMATDTLKTALRQAWTKLGIRETQQEKFLADFDECTQ